MYAMQELKLLTEPVDLTTASGRVRCLQHVSQMMIYISTLSLKLDLEQPSKDKYTRGGETSDSGW